MEAARPPPIVFPSKPPQDIVDRLRELKKCDGLHDAPTELRRRILESTPIDCTLVLWGQRTYNGLEGFYSIESIQAASETLQLYGKKPMGLRIMYVFPRELLY